MTGPQLYLRRARLVDVDTILRFRAETVAWLSRSHPGTDQWRNPYPRATLERWVRRGETFMAAVRLGGPTVATITSSSEGDPALWSPSELAVPARYVSKLNVDRRFAGFGFGATLMDWARTRAACEAALVLRIDVWSTNTRLHDFYRGLGFRPLRVVPEVDSGALFELPAEEVVDVPVVELFDRFYGDVDWLDERHIPSSEARATRNGATLRALQTPALG